MASQFDVTAEQKKVLAERTKRRLALREEFLKQSSNPFKHASGEGGIVFDPAVQRFMAMRVNTYDHFKPTPRTIGWGSFFILIPMFGYGYLVKTSRDKREASYRNGEVSYSDRKFKFV